MKKHLLFLFTFSFLLSPLSSFSQNGTWFWASYGKYGGTNVGDGQNLIAVDNTGNCFYTGFLSGDSVTFGSYTLRNSTNQGYYQPFLVKFDHHGNVLWARQAIQQNNEADGNGYVVCTDAPGNSYIMANFRGNLMFGPYQLTTQPNNGGYCQDMFLVKYDPDGNVLWTKQSQVPTALSQVDGNSLISDFKGNSYVTGQFIDTVHFGATTLKCFNQTANYTFLVKYDLNGNVKWAVQSTGRSLYGSGAGGVAVNNANAVFVAGGFADSVTFGLSKLVAINGNMFVVKYDTNGNVKWAKQPIVPAPTDYIYQDGITADNFGNVYVTGNFGDTIIFGKDTLISNSYDAFLVKYDSIGNVVWAVAPTILDNNNWGPSSLSSDNKGNIYMAGGGGAPGLCKIAFGTDTLSVNDTAIADGPSFIVKFDSSGKVLCASMTRCSSSQWNGIASDTSGNFVYFGGLSVTPSVFGRDTLPFGSTPFVARWQECDSSVIFAGTSQVKQPNAEVKVYPNPSKGMFTLACHSEQSEESPTKTEVYNILGEQILIETLRSSQGDNVIDLSNQPNGIYLYRVVSENGTLIGSGKLVIEK